MPYSGWIPGAKGASARDLVRGKLSGASLVAQRLKRLPPVQGTRVQSLAWEDHLEKEMVTHSSILAWRIPWMEEPGRLQSTGSQSRTRLSDFTFTFKLSKGQVWLHFS